MTAVLVGSLLPLDSQWVHHPIGLSDLNLSDLNASFAGISSVPSTPMTPMALLNQDDSQSSFCYVWLKYYYDYYYYKPGFTLTAVLVGSLLTLAVTNSICNQFHFDSCSCG